MIYSGLGLLAIGIYGCVFFAFWFVTLIYTKDEKIFFNNILLSTFSFFIAGLSVWLIGRWMNKLNPLKVLEMQDGERRVVSKPRHTIYALEMEYWGIILFFISLLVLLAHKVGLV